MKKQILCVGMAVLLMTGTVFASDRSSTGEAGVETVSPINGAEKRTMQKEYPNFRIDSIRIQGIPASSRGSDLEVINRQTGDALLRVPWQESNADTISVHSFYPIDDETLLWASTFIGTALAEYHLLKLDGSMEKVDADFQIIAQDARGRFLVQKDKIPSRSGEYIPAETFRWLFGIVDRDLQTVLLPFEYDEDPKIDIGNKVYSWVPHWNDGYMILKKDGKCGVIDFNLNEVIPFQYDELSDGTYHTARYTKGKEHGVLFLDSGKEIPNCLFPADTPHTVTVQSLDESTYYLYNRYGELLYQSEEHIFVSSEPSVEVGLAGSQIPAVANISAWAEAEVNAARTVRLIPADVDWLYIKPASRRDFCKLIMQMLETERPSVIRKSRVPSQERFWDVSSHSSYDETSIADAAETGIISGFPDGSFHPYAQLTRQDAAVMIAKAADLLGITPNALPLAFSDFEQTGEYAKPAVQAVAALQAPNGTPVMGGGSSGRFDPQGTYTIEQAIAAIYRLYLAAKS